MAAAVEEEPSAARRVADADGGFPRERRPWAVQKSALQLVIEPPPCPADCRQVAHRYEAQHNKMIFFLKVKNCHPHSRLLKEHVFTHAARSRPTTTTTFF